MMKTYLTAAVLTALIAAPAAAQQLGGSDEGSAMGADSSGMSGGDESVQETQIPQDQPIQEPATGATSLEPELPAAETQVPADESGQSMDQPEQQQPPSQP